EAAGELAGRVGLFPVIDDEGEEIAALVGFAFDGGHQGNGVAKLHQDGAVGLLGEPAGFDAELVAAEVLFNTTCLHGEFLTQTGRSSWRVASDRWPGPRLLPQAQPVDEREIPAAVLVAQ